MEPIGGLYRALAGERSARGVLRAERARAAAARLLLRATTWTTRRSGRSSIRPSGHAQAHRRPYPCWATSFTTRRAGAPVRSWCERGPICRVSRADHEHRARATGTQSGAAAAIDAAGTVFVSAGAGTGKTTVIVERFLARGRARRRRQLDPRRHLHRARCGRAALAHPGEARGDRPHRSRPSARRRLDLDHPWLLPCDCCAPIRAAAGVDPRFRVLDESQASVLRRRRS